MTQNRAAAPQIVQIVNSDFGVRNTIGARAWHIARAWAESEHSRADDIAVFARGSSRDAARQFSVRRCGLGSLGTRALAAVQLSLWRRFPYRAIRNRAFHRATERAVNRLNLDQLQLVHSWVAMSDEMRRLRARTPALVTLYDTSMAPDREQVERKFTGFDYFLSPSPYVSEGLIRYGVAPQRIFLVPFGVDVELFRPAESVADAPDTLRVAFTGQLNARKGVPELLSVWKAIAPANAELHLYGRVHHDARDAIASLGNLQQHRVFLHGFVDLTTELAKNHLYVLPSHREGSAKSVYEAMACALPVITTPNAGSVVRDGEDGYLIPAGDTDALADRLRLLLADPDARARMGASARRRVKQFTWDHYGRAVVDVYRRLMSLTE